MLDTDADELERLRHANRDLAACLALPAMWAGREPRYILATLLDVLVSMLGLELACAVIRDAGGEAVLEECRPRTPAALTSIADVLARWPNGDVAGPIVDVPGVGNVRLARAPLRLQSDAGIVVAGSLHRDFPSERDDLLLRAAVNQAAIALNNAQLMSREQSLLAREQAARREAEGANRAKDQFLAVLSHELRTPLTTMLGWVRILRTTQLDPAQQERALEAIERNTLAQAHMIDDLLDMSRIAAGKMTLDRRPLSLALLVSETVEALRHQATAKGLSLETHVDLAAGPVSADPDRIRQVLANLLANALKFTPAGGRVEVHLVVSGDIVRLIVRDTGGGIGPELLPHVFERFRQADWRKAGMQGGLGLGLAIVREIVELHGGTVEAQSDGPGRGAAFIVTLPVIRGATDAEPLARA